MVKRKEYKGTNNDLQNLHIELKIDTNHYKQGWNVMFCHNELALTLTLTLALTLTLTLALTLTLTITLTLTLTLALTLTLTLAEQLLTLH